jgi:hypothetical protein
VNITENKQVTLFLWYMGTNDFLIGIMKSIKKCVCYTSFRQIIIIYITSYNITNKKRCVLLVSRNLTYASQWTLKLIK